MSSSAPRQRWLTVGVALLAVVFAIALAGLVGASAADAAVPGDVMPCSWTACPTLPDVSGPGASAPSWYANLPLAEQGIADDAIAAWVAGGDAPYTYAAGTANTYLQERAGAAIADALSSYSIGPGADQAALLSYKATTVAEGGILDAAESLGLGPLEAAGADGLLLQVVPGVAEATAVVSVVLGAKTLFAKLAVPAPPAMPSHITQLNVQPPSHFEHDNDPGQDPNDCEAGRYILNVAAVCGRAWGSGAIGQRVRVPADSSVLTYTSSGGTVNWPSDNTTFASGLITDTRSACALGIDLPSPWVPIIYHDTQNCDPAHDPQNIYPVEAAVYYLPADQTDWSHLMGAPLSTVDPAPLAPHITKIAPGGQWTPTTKVHTWLDSPAAEPFRAVVDAVWQSTQAAPASDFAPDPTLITIPYQGLDSQASEPCGQHDGLNQTQATAATCAGALRALGFTNVDVHYFASAMDAQALTGSAPCSFSGGTVGTSSCPYGSWAGAWLPAVNCCEWPVPLNDLDTAAVGHELDPAWYWSWPDGVTLPAATHLIVYGEPLPATTSVPAPFLHETYPKYLTRLQDLGLVGHVVTLDASQWASGLGVNEVVSTSPVAGTTVATQSQVDVNVNPSVAPSGGTSTGPDYGTAPDPTTGASNCGMTPPSSAIDLSPITGLHFGDVFPFSMLTAATADLAGIAGTAAVPNPSVSVFGQTAELGPGITRFASIIDVCRTVGAWLILMSAAWFLWRRVTG
jgi:hypothetical protein